MKTKLITIVGQTATGKSALGIALAQKFNSEIISADSRQIYKGFDLCSGKVTKAEQRQVPHHMIDIVNIGEAFSAYDFQLQAYNIIDNSPLATHFLVGGTGLYVAAVAAGYDMKPSHSDNEKATNLRNELDAHSVAQLQNMLTPTAKEQLQKNNSDYNNKRRLIRIIEKTIAGEPITKQANPKYNVLQLGCYWQKDKLHKRIDQRLKERIDQGMIEEVETYLKNGANPLYLENLGLEYRYTMHYLTGVIATKDEYVEVLSRSIKNFAKRQGTWFRKDDSIKWLDMEDSGIVDKAFKLVLGF